MKLNEKLFPLTPYEIKLIEKQLKKEGIEPVKNWHKQVISLMVQTDEGDCFYTIFHKKTKTLYTSCSIWNDVDEFDFDIGEIIAINRMGKHLNFQEAVNDYQASLLLSMSKLPFPKVSIPTSVIR